MGDDPRQLRRRLQRLGGRHRGGLDVGDQALAAIAELLPVALQAGITKVEIQRLTPERSPACQRVDDCPARPFRSGCRRRIACRRVGGAVPGRGGGRRRGVLVHRPVDPRRQEAQGRPPGLAGPRHRNDPLIRPPAGFRDSLPPEQQRRGRTAPVRSRGCLRCGGRRRRSRAARGSCPGGRGVALQAHARCRAGSRVR
jgi:hypothetical protein